MSQTVFSNSQTAHVWAQQNQPSGRNSNDTFYFQTHTIFSYGNHFPIARFLKGEKWQPLGESVVLFTTSSYSVTTSAHISHVRQSINYGKAPGIAHVFNVPNVGHHNGDHGPKSRADFMWKETHKENLKAYVDRFETTLKLASRARSYREHYLTSAQKIATERAEYAKYFGIKVKPITMPTDMDKWMADAKEANKKAKAKADKAELKRRHVMRVKADANQLEWLDGSVASAYKYHQAYPSTGAMLRLNGDNVETSKGADVPTKHAKSIWKALGLAKRWAVKHGETYRVPPQKPVRVGLFQINSVSQSGLVVAGCHEIEWSEFERIAAELGLIETATV